MCSWSRLRRGCPRLRLAPGCRLGAGMTAEEGTRAKNKRRGIRWCAPLCTVACSFLFCHSGLRAGILGGFMRGIVPPLIASPVFIPRQHPPGCRIKCGMTALVRRLCYPRGCCRGLPSRETLCTTSLQCLACASQDAGSAAGMTAEEGRAEEKGGGACVFRGCGVRVPP